MFKKFQIKMRKRWLFLIITLLLLAGLVALGIKKYSADEVTPPSNSFLQLQTSPKPNFKPGNTLPRLSYWLGGGIDYNTQKELTEDWGYATQLSLGNANFLTNHTYPAEKIQYDTMELAKSDPDRYPIFIIPRHYWGSGSTYTLPESMWCHLDGVNGTEATRILSSLNGYTLQSEVDADDMTIETQKEITATQTYHDPYTGSNKTITRPASGWIVIGSETMAYSSFSGNTWTISQRGAFGTTAAVHAQGVLISEKPQLVYSPEAPTSIFEETGANWAGIVKQVMTAYPTVKVSVALNGAEYGLAPSGVDYLNWYQDPDVRAARIAYNNAHGNETYWFNYISYNKARQEEPIAAAFKAILPSDTLYVNYGIGGGSRLASNPSWIEWGFDYTKMRVAADVPSHESYFGPYPYHQSWTQTGNQNIFDLVTNAITQQIDAGDPLSYAFVSGGWGSVVSDQSRYTGFIKMLYAMGNIGAAQYYSDTAENDPNWLWQFEELGHVHALYSWLEDYLRGGDLLPGPNKHKWSTDLPAYEFPNTANDQWARVVARKKTDSNDWLIAAWAQDGADRNVTVTIPVLGTVTVNARVAGSVYTAKLVDGQPVLTLIDVNALNPTDGISARVDDGVNPPTPIPNLSRTFTYKAKVTISGTKTTDITKVLVNNVEATVDNVNNTWTLDQDLSYGSNTITIIGKDQTDASSSTTTRTIIRRKPADANNDGNITIADFGSLMSNWNKQEANNIADFNEDGSVGIADFSIMMSSWGN